MEGVFDFLNQGWIGSLIGVISIFGTIISISVAIYFYIAAKRDPKPVYQHWSLRILGKNEDNLPQDVSVSFKGIEINRLNRTTIIFWNGGTKVLNGSDIVKEDPLIISYPEGSKILSYQILRQTKEVNGFSLKLVPDKPNMLLIDFEYLDPKGGATCEIVHDSEKRDPEVLGSIKGIPSGFKALGKMPNSLVKRILLYPLFPLVSQKGILGEIFLCIMLLGSVIIAIFGIILKEALFEKIFFLVAGILYTFWSASSLWMIRRKYPKNLDVSDDLL